MMKRLAGITLVVFLFSAAGFSFVDAEIDISYHTCDFSSANFINLPESVIHPFQYNPNFSSLDDEDETLKILLFKMFLSERMKTSTITYLSSSNLSVLITDIIFCETDSSPPPFSLLTMYKA